MARIILAVLAIATLLAAVPALSGSASADCPRGTGTPRPD